MKSQILLFIFALLLGSNLTFAQRTIAPPPPPQGPNPATGDYRPNGVIPSPLIEIELEKAIDEYIAAANAQACRMVPNHSTPNPLDSIRVCEYQLRWKSGSSKAIPLSASILKTERRDQPNQNYIQIPYRVQIEAYDLGPINTNRTITFYVNAQIFCRDWQSSNGQVALFVKTTKPVVSGGGNIFEVLFNLFSVGHLSSYITQQVQSRLGSIAGQAPNIPGNLSCNCLNLTQYQNNPPAYSIEWVKKASRPYMLTTRAQVTLENVRRVPDSQSGSTPEEVSFEIWVNGRLYNVPNGIQSKLIMNEGQQVATGVPAFSVPLGTIDNSLQVFVVVKAKRGGSAFPNIVSTGWVHFTSANKYGDGNQKVVTKKEVIRPPSQFNPKPTSILVNDYELQFKVVYINPLEQQNTQRPVIAH